MGSRVTHTRLRVVVRLFVIRLGARVPIFTANLQRKKAAVIHHEDYILNILITKSICFMHGFVMHNFIQSYPISLFLTAKSVNLYYT